MDDYLLGDTVELRLPGMESTGVRGRVLRLWFTAMLFFALVPPNGYDVLWDDGTISEHVPAFNLVFIYPVAR